MRVHPSSQRWRDLALPILGVLVAIGLFITVVISLVADRSFRDRQRTAARGSQQVEPAPGEPDPSASGGPHSASHDSASREPGGPVSEQVASSSTASEGGGAQAVRGSALPDRRPDDPPNDSPDDPLEASAVGAGPVEPEPWMTQLARDRPMPRFEDACFQGFEPHKSLPRVEEIESWLVPVEGYSHATYPVRSTAGACAAIKGLLRLRAPLREETTLRLGLESFDRLRIHCFHGAHGITLAFYQNENFRWAAYRTTRKIGLAVPERMTLLTTDEDRYRRTEPRAGSPLELRYRQGRLWLSRGDLILLAAPLEEAPGQVYFEGGATIQGLTLDRDSDFPDLNLEGPSWADSPPPASLEWSPPKASGVRLQRESDLSVSLIASQGNQRGQVFGALPELGLRELLVEVDEATPGAGLFLCGKDGEPREILRFLRNLSDGQLCLALQANDDTHQAELGLTSERLVSRVESHTWIKLAIGTRTIRWAISPDGHNWAEPGPPLPRSSPEATHLGLHVTAGLPSCRLRIRRIATRAWEGLAGVAPDECVARAAAVSAPDFAAWEAAVAAMQPEAIEAGTWRRATALRTLRAGCPPALAHDLMIWLLDDVADGNLPLETRLAALRDGARVLDTWDDAAQAERHTRRFHRVARRAFDENDEPPYSRIRHAVMSAPLLTRHPIPVGEESLARAELIQLTTERNFPSALQFCRQLRFFSLHEKVQLLPWAEALAVSNVAPRGLAHAATAVPPTRWKPEWRGPLVEELNKDAYNIVAEIDSLLTGDNVEDVAQRMATLGFELPTGLTTSPDDAALLVSLPIALRLVIDRHPRVTASIASRFADLAELRLQRAIGRGDEESAMLIANVLRETRIGAEANRWLAERSLARGEFPLARRRFETSLAGDPGSQAELLPRIRLAASLAGEDVGKIVTESVQLGGATFSAETFEALVTRLRERVPPERPSVERSSSVPPPGSQLAEVRGRLEGLVGESPQTQVTRDENRWNVDWATRQLATASEGEMLYVGNRFHVAAYRMADGQRVWQSERPQTKMLRARDWTLVPMRPLVASTHVFARLLYGDGPTLVAIDKATGKLVWASELPRAETLISDPLPHLGTLGALSLVKNDDDESSLRWVTFDPRTGRVESRVSLARVRDSWHQRRCCTVRALDDGFVAVLGGAVLRAHASGRVDWVRSQTLVPAGEDTSWLNQSFDPPVLAGDRLIVAQPGVRAIECLDVETGKLYWRRVFPDLRRILGVARGMVVAQTDAAVVSMAIADGQPSWSTPLAQPLDGHLVDDARILVTCREAGSAPNQFRAKLVWLDASTGETQHAAALAALEDPDPRLGALVAGPSRLWSFFGRGQLDPHRDLVRITPGE